MKKKYIDGSNIDKEWLLKYTSKFKYIGNTHDGYISLVHFERVNHVLYVDYDASETILVDNGYKCIVYMPLTEKWCVTVFLNRDHDIIEWYFDMTSLNAVENGKPFFMDLYLDIAVSPDGKVTVLDEDELIEALDLGIISSEEVEMARNTCKQLIDEVIPDENFMISFFHEQLGRLL